MTEYMKKRSLELLAPAANADIAIEAVKHGADAVYIGAMSHGARKSAANSIEDIRRVVDFAHQYRARVYVTVNTIVYENELKSVERLCRELYKAGVDALIVQDMALLRLDLPPIALHASTQCDIRTPGKAKFLEEVGFSQLVLARELSLKEIEAITSVVTVPVECFVHGALCVSYSGRCHASCATTGRSANRGECSQLCRLPYTLRDAQGRILSKDRHLLSLRDFNAYPHLRELVEAGVSSFKIEGRLKEVDYVKNITAYYSGGLNSIIADAPGQYERSSYGKVTTTFTPRPEKSFNRGFTDYFLTDRRPAHIASLRTPKSMGEIIKDISTLNNGDGISYFDRDGNYQGVNVNKVEGRRIITGRKVDIPRDAEIHRTSDIEWQKRMARETASRRIGVSVTLDDTGLTASDARGMMVRLPLEVNKDEARKPMDFRGEFAKLGNTIYELENFDCTIPETVFIPRSELGVLRRKMVEALDMANLSTYHYDMRRKENPDFPYPYDRLDYRDNVANSVSFRFYEEHGVKEIERAMEVDGSRNHSGKVLMTTRHCILRELGMCRRDSSRKLAEPLEIVSGNRAYNLRFNCGRCEMEVLGRD